MESLNYNTAKFASIDNGLLYQFNRYDKDDIERHCKPIDNLGLLQVQGKFQKERNIYCYNITIYILFEKGMEKFLLSDKENMRKELIRMNPDANFGDLEIDEILYGTCNLTLQQFLSSGYYMKPHIGPSYFYFYAPHKQDKM